MNNLGRHIGRLIAASGLGKQAGPIGVDLGSQYVKMLQFQRHPEGGLVIVTKAKQLPENIQQDWRPHIDELASFIKSIIQSCDFVGSDVVGCIPGGLMECRNIRLEPVSDNELDGVVQSYATDQLEFPVDHFKTQCIDAGIVWDEDERRQEIIAMAVPLEIVSDYLSVFTRVGLTPVCVDAVPAAMARGVMDVMEIDAPCVIVDVGYRWTSLVIVSQNEIRFVRRVNIGIGLLDHDIADILHIPLEDAKQLRETIGTREDEASGNDESSDASTRQVLNVVLEERCRQLAKEISKCLQYYAVTFCSSKPKNAVVLGGGGCNRAFVDSMTQVTRMICQSLDQLANVGWVEKIGKSAEAGLAGSFAVAAGLAKYGLSAGVKGDAA